MLTVLYAMPVVSSTKLLQEFAEANWDEAAEDQEDLQQWQVRVILFL